jgi:hypothetical protein
MPKKNENQNKSIKSECLINFTLRNVVLNEKNIDLLLLLMSINYESIYRSKLSMITPIIHNSK